MINFTNPDENMQAKRKLSKKVTGWVEDALPDEYEDWIVMVNEMQCYEPVCRRARILSSRAWSLTHGTRRHTSCASTLATGTLPRPASTGLRAFGDGGELTRKRPAVGVEGLQNL